MCGIVGLFTYQYEDDSLDPIVRALTQRMLFMESLVLSEPRGKDATGIALLRDDGDTAILKQPVEASHFAKDDGLWGEDYKNPEDDDANFKWINTEWMRRHSESQLKIALGHVRLGTKGSQYITHNNHPIIVSSEEFGDGGEIKGSLTVGVHNGGIKNDIHLINKHKLKMKGNVDSEVIFQLMHKYSKNFTIEALKDTFRELTGLYAVMAFNPDNPNKVACMRETRPLNAAYLPSIGTLALISDSSYLDGAIEEYERWRIREGDSIYTYIDDKGEQHELGKVYEVFPYIIPKWYSTTKQDSIEEGVFILDLDTKVDDDTDVKDLVKLEKVTPKTVVHSNTTPSTNTTPTNTEHNRSGGTNLSDNRSASAPAVSEDKKKTEDKTNKKEGIIDHTDYSADEDGVDTSIYSASQNEEAGTEVDVEIDLPAEEDTEHDDGCPWTFNERKSMAADALYDENDTHRLHLTLDPVQIKESLERYFVKPKDTDEAVTIMSCMYDLIFPEGFAVGFAKGFDEGKLDLEADKEGDNEVLAEYSRRIAQLEETLKAKNTAISLLQEKIEEISKRHRQAGKYIATARPILFHVFNENNVLDKNGKIEKEKLNELLKKWGIKPDQKTCSLAQRILGNR